jgi:hypothetical protein
LFYTALIATDLPSTLGPPTPAPPLVALGQLLSTGRAHLRHASCDLTAGAVLAGVFEALSTLGARSITVRDDADVLFETAIAAAPGDPLPRSPEALPPRWTREPASFHLVAPLPEPVDGAPLAASVQLRFTPRYPADAAALTGAVRLVWTPPAELDGRDHRRALQRGLPNLAEARALRTRLEGHGDALRHRLEEALCDAVGPTSSHALGAISAAALDDHPAAYQALLQGLPAGVERWLAAINDRVATLGLTLPALDARGVPGRITSGRFTPVAEAPHG